MSVGIDSNAISKKLFKINNLIDKSKAFIVYGVAPEFI
jgi:hypothetical protein